jgi:putative exosortase-associated protein (TIGR04073 family)
MAPDHAGGFNIMRIRFLSLIMCLFLMSGTSAVAEETGILRQIGSKLVRGVVNFSTGWAELPKQIYVVGRNEGWIAGAFRGPFDGMGMFFARTIAGAYEIVSFPVPVPPDYHPLLRPEFVWQAEPAPPPEQ